MLPQSSDNETNIETQKLSMYPYINPDLSIKPRFLKIFNQILTTYSSPILNYLSLIELSSCRLVNKTFNTIINEYYEKRLKNEIQDITDFQLANQEKTQMFMKNIDSQIPISNKNWLNFNLNEVTEKIQSLDRNTITHLRSIKNLGKLTDNVFAPFCIIFGYNKSNNQKVRADGWKKTAGILLNDPNFFLKASRLDLENFNDNEMLEAFVILNSPELEVNNIKKFSKSLAKLIEWCQSIVSYHILIHPYTYRNDKCNIKEGSEIYEFALQMDEMINRFYKYKRFLFNLKLIQIPLGDYVFNLQHSRELLPTEKDLGSYLNEDIIGNILSYIIFNKSFKFMNVNKLFFKGFKKSIDKNCFEILKELFIFKLRVYDQLSQKVPIIFENNIFSKYFLMLDDILNNDLDIHEDGFQFTPFLTKEQITDLKKIKLKSDSINVIAKIACILLNIKPQRKPDKKGEIKSQYLEAIKTQAVNGKLLKNMRRLNKLELNNKQIKSLSDELIQFYSTEKLNEIKNMNRGIYQLLIWELFIFEYLKEFNPFIFLNLNYLPNSNQLSKEELDSINYYIDMLNYFKYNLKAKYHYSSVNLQSSSKYPSYNFIILMDNLYTYLTNEDLKPDRIFDTINPDHAKISTVYFESRDLIPVSAKPALYERIMIEIISTTINNNVETISSQNELGTIKEENSIINTGNNNILNNAAMTFGMKENNFINSLRNSNPQNYNNNNSLKNNSSNNNRLKNVKKQNYYTTNNNSNDNQENIENIFDCLSDEYLIKNLLFFLDYNSLPFFGLVCKRFNKCLKTHIFIRLYLLNKEKKTIEDEHSNIIEGIENKRKNFFNEYELLPPEKEHSYKLMRQITSDDISELKQIYRKYNKNKEALIAPLVILLDGKPNSGFKYDGSKKIDYFKPAQKIINSKEFIKKIQNLELETIPIQKFQKVEKLISDRNFINESVKILSPCLSHLINWEMGVVEFHRVVRPYSLSYYDYNILDKNEIEFCLQMDNIVIIYYKLLKYTSKYCKQYEKDARELMNSMDLDDDINEEEVNN